MPIGPINYSTGVDSPITALNTGFNTGANIVSTGQLQQQNALALQTQQSLQADAKAMGANPTPQNIATLVAKYPMLADKFKPAYDMLTEQQQKAKLDQAIPIYAAVSSGAYDTAAKLLNQQADGFEAAGDKANALSSRTMAQLVTDHPELAKSTFGIALASVMPPDKFAETFGKLSETNIAQAKAPGEVKKINSDADTAAATAAVAPVVAQAGASSAVSKATTDAAGAAVAAPKAAAEASQAQSKAVIDAATAGAAPETVALNNKKIASDIEATAAKQKLDQDTLTTNTQLKLKELGLQYGQIPPSSQTIVNDSTVKSVAADAVADKFGGFANKIDQYTNSLGGKVGNTIGKFITDNAYQSEWTDARNEYNRLRAAGIAANLPPQVTRLTDSDLKIFGKGIPTDTDSPERMAAFLRSMQTMKKLEAVQEDAKSQWAAYNQKGGLGPATRDMNIGGVEVPQGLTLPLFIRQYETTKMTQYAKQSATDTVNSRPYMSYATNAPGTANANGKGDLQ